MKTGIYFIGYSRSPSTTEEMLQNMFVGKPPGNYDRLLDFSRAVAGVCSSCHPRHFWREPVLPTPSLLEVTVWI